MSTPEPPARIAATPPHRYAGSIPKFTQLTKQGQIRTLLWPNGQMQQVMNNQRPTLQAQTEIRRMSFLPYPHSRGPSLFLLAYGVQSADNASIPTFLRASPHQPPAPASTK